MSKISPAIAGLAILVSVSAVQAQGFGSGGGPETLDPAICDQMASIPNAPMSAEACRAMIGMAKGVQAGASDPSARRPGDESMSCDQIVAEMKASGGPMVSQTTAAQSKEAADATLALMQKQNAEMKAFMAGQMAVGIGAGALSMVPGGGIASSAIMQAQQAQTQNFAAKQAADAAPVRAQSNQAMIATSTEVGQAMQNNPRFARLTQLAGNKNCTLTAEPTP